MGVQRVPATNAPARHRASFSISERWREIQGSNDWQGLIDPQAGTLDEVLREEILRYGNFTQLCYDNFDCDAESPYYGACKLRRRHFLGSTPYADDYNVTKYLYANGESSLLADAITALCGSSLDAANIHSLAYPMWIGYVAVCTSPMELARLGRRDIVVCWRGTVTPAEWATDFRDLLVPAQPSLALGRSDRVDVAATVAETEEAAPLVPHAEIHAQFDVQVERQQIPQRHELFRSASSRAPDKAAGKHPRERHFYHVFGRSQSVSLRRDELDSDVAVAADDDLMMAVKVEHGFLGLYTESASTNILSAKQQLCEEIQRLVELYKDDDLPLSITVTGHSLGGALATVSAYDLALLYHRSKDVANITAFTFGSPRVGNRAFKEHVNAMGVKILRVANEKDVVPKVPGILGNERNAVVSYLLQHLPWTYFHVGTEFRVNTELSPILKATSNPHDHHNLEVYLHLVDGCPSPHEVLAALDETPKFAPHGRDIALINKRTSLLLQSYRIPSHWWQEENKGMHRNAAGMWVVRDTPTPEDDN